MNVGTVAALCRNRSVGEVENRVRRVGGEVHQRRVGAQCWGPLGSPCLVDDDAAVGRCRQNIDRNDAGQPDVSAVGERARPFFGAAWSRDRHAGVPVVLSGDSDRDVGGIAGDTARWNRLQDAEVVVGIARCLFDRHAVCVERARINAANALNDRHRRTRERVDRGERRAGGDLALRHFGGRAVVDEVLTGIERLVGNDRRRIHDIGASVELWSKLQARRDGQRPEAGQHPVVVEGEDNVLVIPVNSEQVGSKARGRLSCIGGIGDPNTHHAVDVVGSAGVRIIRHHELRFNRKHRNVDWQSVGHHKLAERAVE